MCVRQRDVRALLLRAVHGHAQSCVPLMPQRYGGLGRGDERRGCPSASHAPAEIRPSAPAAARSSAARRAYRPRRPCRSQDTVVFMRLASHMIDHAGKDSPRRSRCRCSRRKRRWRRNSAWKAARQRRRTTCTVANARRHGDDGAVDQSADDAGKRALHPGDGDDGARTPSARPVLASRRCSPATPTSYSRTTRFPSTSAVSAASSATGIVATCRRSRSTIFPSPSGSGSGPTMPSYGRLRQ